MSKLDDIIDSYRSASWLSRVTMDSDNDRAVRLQALANITTKQQIKDLIKSELQKYIREEPYKEEDFDTGWNNAIYAMQDVIEEL